MNRDGILKIIGVILGIFSISLVFGQSPAPRLVTAEDFLGNNLPPDVYDIEVDTNGFVYFVYPGGLWRFNGTNVESEWKLENPLNPIVYYSIHKGYNDQLLLAGPFGVAYIKEDSLLEFPIPDSIVKLGRKWYESVYLDQEGLLHIAPRNYGYFTVDPQGNVMEIMGKSSRLNGFVMTLLPSGEPFHFSITNHTSTKPPALYFKDTDSSLHFISKIKPPIYESSLVQYTDGTFMFCDGNNNIVHFDKNELIMTRTVDFKGNKLFIDSRDILWIGTVDNGFFKVDSPDFSNVQHFCNGASAALTESFDKGIWFKSDSLKFGYIPPTNVLNYSDQNGYPMLRNIVQLNSAGEQIIIFNENGEVFLLQEDKVQKLNLPSVKLTPGLPPNFNHPRTSLYDEKTKTIWLAYYGELQSWNGNKLETLKLDESEFSSLRVTDLNISPEGRIMGATRNEFFEIIDGKIVQISESTTALIESFLVDDRGKIWVRTEEGLWILEQGKFLRPFKKMPKELLKSSLFIESTQGTIWYQPTLDGLFQIKRDTVVPVFDQYGKRIKLYAHAVTPDGDLWATLHKSGQLCRINEKNRSLNVQYYAFDDLAISAQGSEALLIMGDEVFFGARHGLFKQQIKDLTTQEIQSKVVITEVRINHHVVAIKESYNLSHHENYINLTFNGISFRRIPLVYSYFLDGLDTNWHETKNTQVQYTHLPPGEYIFKLRVKTIHGEWTKPVKIRFLIAKPYWQMWPFRIGATLLFLLFVGLSIRFRVVYIQRKEAEKGRIALELSRLELSALKAQMNPHFIFNTLKSIQNKILKGGKWEANELLVRFSKLIRSSLEYSRADFISLSDEIDFLRNYLEIEKQRLPGKFDFEIVIDDKDELQDLLVPSLLIQPICENAINYAFENENGNLLLKLKLVQEDLIEVQITDNGIGYFNAQKANSAKPQSLGLGIVQARLDLFKSQDYETSLRIEALDHATNRGTHITLRMPCK